MNLNDTWTNCIAMWTFIVEMRKTCQGQMLSISRLKSMWIRENDFGPHDIEADCFFCDYNTRKGDSCDDCESCPGRKIDLDFYCGHKEYDYVSKPEAFLAKIIELHKIRNRKKKIKKT